MRQVARELIDQGCAVEVWSVDRGTGPVTRELDGVTVRYLPTPLPSGSPGGVAWFARASPGAWRRWADARAAFRPDLLHVHCFGPNGVYALALHHRYRLPLMVTSHGETIADDSAVYDRSALLRAALRRALAAAPAVTAPSGFVLDDLRARFGLVGGEVVPNGVDLDLVGDARRSPFKGEYVLAVGRLGRTKGFDLLVEAMSGLRRDDSAAADVRSDSAVGRDIRLVIVGDGPEQAGLETLVRELGLEGRVVLAGRLGPLAVADAMAGALAIVVPSRTEAFGIVALEAWRSGAALVMTNRGGAPGFVADGVDGLLVDPLDIDALRSTIRRVVDDPELRARLVDAGRRRVTEFTWRRVAEAYLADYDRILDGDDARDRQAAETA